MLEKEKLSWGECSFTQSPGFLPDLINIINIITYHHYPYEEECVEEENGKERDLEDVDIDLGLLEEGTVAEEIIRIVRVWMMHVESRCHPECKIQNWPS